MRSDEEKLRQIHDMVACSRIEELTFPILDAVVDRPRGCVRFTLGHPTTKERDLTPLRAGQWVEVDTSMFGTMILRVREHTIDVQVAQPVVRLMDASCLTRTQQGRHPIWNH